MKRWIEALRRVVVGDPAAKDLEAPVSAPLDWWFSPVGAIADPIADPIADRDELDAELRAAARTSGPRAVALAVAQSLLWSSWFGFGVGCARPRRPGKP